ncbi:unnamed protein product, partial [Phaeothamnion confervicola]
KQLNLTSGSGGDGGGAAVDGTGASGNGSTGAGTAGATAGAAAAGTGAAPGAAHIHAACTFVNSFFYTQSAALLAACPFGNDGLRRLISKAGITDMFALSKLCMPINFGHNHWLLGVIDMAGKRFII